MSTRNATPSSTREASPCRKIRFVRLSGTMVRSRRFLFRDSDNAAAPWAASTCLRLINRFENVEPDRGCNEPEFPVAAASDFSLPQFPHEGRSNTTATIREFREIRFILNINALGLQICLFAERFTLPQRGREAGGLSLWGWWLLAGVNCSPSP